MLWRAPPHQPGTHSARQRGEGVKLLTTPGFPTEEDKDMLEEWQVYYLRDLNDYLYGTVIESIDREEKWGQALLLSVMNEDANIMGSVGLLVHHIVQAGTHMTSDQAKARLMEIDAMYLSLNDSPEDMELTCNSLMAKWNSIPEQKWGHPHLVYDKLLDLLPIVCADDKKSLQTNINTRQTMGEQMPTYEQVSQGIIT